MPSQLRIDHDSIQDNDVARQVEFTAELDGDEVEFAVKYAVLKELSGDEPEDDAADMFERFSDEILDICEEVAAKRPAAVIVIDEDDLE